MNIDIDVFREAVLADARRAAQRRIEEAERDAEQRLEDARRRSESRVADARREGREAAEREDRRSRLEARREARSLVLREQRLAVEKLRERALEQLRGERGSEAYERLMARVEQLARQQLGPEAEIERDAEVGGLVARAGRRRVDYRLPALVDRVIEELGSELEALWA